jgi:hypothetical protein
MAGTPKGDRDAGLIEHPPDREFEDSFAIALEYKPPEQIDGPQILCKPRGQGLRIRLAQVVALKLHIHVNLSRQELPPKCAVD